MIANCGHNSIIVFYTPRRIASFRSRKWDTILAIRFTMVIISVNYPQGKNVANWSIKKNSYSRITSVVYGETSLEYNSFKQSNTALSITPTFVRLNHGKLNLPHEFSKSLYSNLNSIPDLLYFCSLI